MITRFSIRNFKRLGDVTLELGSAAVLIGANNSGKTTALQALALWDIGWRRWAEKRDKSSAKDRPGVTINRRDLYAIPVPSAKLSWADLHTQVGSRAEGKPKNDPVYITLTAEGDLRGRPWRRAFDFYYANEESFYCRLRDGDDGKVPEGTRHRAPNHRTRRPSEASPGLGELIRGIDELAVSARLPAASAIELGRTGDDMPRVSDGLNRWTLPGRFPFRRLSTPRK